MGRRKGHRRRGPGSGPDKQADALLHEVLERAGFRVHNVESDGNCLFRAFASQVYGDEEMHFEFRNNCCDFMEKEAPEEFEGFLDNQKLSEYLYTMRQDGTWGTQLEIVAMCKRYHVDCVIFRPDGLHYRVECDKPDNEPVPIVMLSHHDEEHFNEVRFKERARSLASFEELDLLLAGAPDAENVTSHRRSTRSSKPSKKAPIIAKEPQRFVEL
jgi:OTU domain-containing protein 3